MPRETVKRTHMLSNRAHRAKVSNGGDTPRGAVGTHALSGRAHRAKVSNRRDTPRDGEENSHAIEWSASGEG